MESARAKAIYDQGQEDISQGPEGIDQAERISTGPGGYGQREVWAAWEQLTEVC